MKSDSRTPRDLLVFPLAALIGVGWLASLVVALTSQEYVALKWTTPALLLLCGYVFGVQIITPLIRTVRPTRGDDEPA